MKITGHEPQSGKQIDQFGCVDSFLPLLLIEVAQQQRQTGAAVESFRNVVVKTNEEQLQRQEVAFKRIGGSG